LRRHRRHFLANRQRSAREPDGVKADSKQARWLRDRLADREAGALFIQANEYAMTLQYQLRGGRVVDTLIISVA
jgi:hypothetical protein